MVYTLRPRHKGHYITDNITKLIFWYKYCCIFIWISSKFIQFIPNDLTKNKPSLVQKITPCYHMKYRSWNNGIRCMSLYIPMNQWWPGLLVFHTWPCWVENICLTQLINLSNWFSDAYTCISQPSSMFTSEMTKLKLHIEDVTLSITLVSKTGTWPDIIKKIWWFLFKSYHNCFFQ